MVNIKWQKNQKNNHLISGNCFEDYIIDRGGKKLLLLYALWVIAYGIELMLKIAVNFTRAEKRGQEKMCHKYQIVEYEDFLSEVCR